jgi:hypothetical protein
MHSGRVPASVRMKRSTLANALLDRPVDNFDYDGLTGSEGVGGHAMFRTRHIDQITSESVKANRRLRARTYLDGTQLGVRSGPCWKC